MPSAEQLQKLWLLSDTVLYSEAVAFIRHLVQDEECTPLPTSQVMGLLNITNAPKYSEVDTFIKHQRDRDWTSSKLDIKKFYTELEKTLTAIKNKRIKDEFQLVSQNLAPREASQQVDELMALLAHDFIQHLLAENGVLAAERAKERAHRR